MPTTEQYLAPQTLEEVTRIAARTGATILAGGTDLHPRWTKEIVPRPAAMVDVKAIEELKGIRQTDGVVCIGACTLMSELETDPIIRAAAPVLADAAGRVACPQIRNRATLGGNLCNASPAADTAVPLLLLEAVIELASSGPDGVALREVPITDFFCGPGVTSLAPGEILTRVRFKPFPEGWFWAWDKFGTRPAMEIAVASVGVVLGWVAQGFSSGGCELHPEVVSPTAEAMGHPLVSYARVAYGSVAPVPMRGRQAEAELVGRRLCESVIEKCTAAAREEIAPITDVRAGEGYRREVVGVMLRRMLQNAERARQG